MLIYYTRRAERPKAFVSVNFATMPVIWIPPALLSIAALSAPPAPVLPDGVRVTAKHVSIDVDRQVITYTDGVIVTFGPTIVSTDHFELHGAPGDEYGEATGHVVLTDLDGTMTANHLRVQWKLKTGEANQVSINASGLHLRAKQVKIYPDRKEMVPQKDGSLREVVTPGRWVLIDAEGYSGRNQIIPFSVRSKQVVVEPGRHATLFNPQVSLFNHHIVSLPTERFNLDKGQQGIGVPMPSLNRDGRVGIGWSGSSLLNEATLVDFRAGAFQGAYPAGRISVAHTFLPAGVDKRSILPASEFGERFRQGFFDNIRTPEFSSEEEVTRDPRYAIGASTYLHVTPSARHNPQIFDVPLELTVERTFAAKGWGVLADARAVSLGEVRRASHTRLNGQVAVSPPRLKLMPGLFAVSRFDGSSFLGDSGFYSWARGQAGLLYQPNRVVSLGGVYYSSVDVGTPDFTIDPLTSKEGFNLRAGLDFGRTRAAYLLKYDRRTGSIYDREYAVSQTIGSFEVSLTYRRFPSQYALAFTFNPSNLFDRLKERTASRVPKSGAKTP